MWLRVMEIAAKRAENYVEAAVDDEDASVEVLNEAARFTTRARDIAALCSHNERAGEVWRVLSALSDELLAVESASVRG